MDIKKLLKESLRSAMPIFIGLTLTVIFYFIIFRFDGLSNALSKLVSILTPFIYGGVMAYLLRIPYDWLEKRLSKILPENKKGMLKGLCVFIVMLFALIIVYLLLIMIIPALVKSIASIIQELPPALTRFQGIISAYTTDNEVLDNYIGQAINGIETNGLEWLKNSILPYLTSLMDGFASTFGSIFGVLYNLFIGVIICIYLLLGKSTFARQGKMLLYSVFKRGTAERALKEIAFIDKTFVGFLGGKILDSAIVGLICYVFCLIMHFSLGMKNIVLIAVLIGVTNIIPFFGPYIGAVPSALVILIDSPVCCLIFIVFIIFLQLFDGNVLGPRLLSQSVGLTGFWVLFSITLFGGIFGFTGVLLGVPVFAVIFDYIRRWVHKKLKKNQITELLPDK